MPMQAVAVSFTVMGAGFTPTGTVAITGADINCSITLSGGTGSCNVIFNTIGAKILTATYSGDSNYLSSVDTEPHDVKNASTTTITSDISDPSLPDTVNPVIVTVTVSGAGVFPTGTVNITGADTVCAIVLAGGTGNCPVWFYTAGAKVLTATYVGDVNYVGSVGTATHTVNKGPSTTVVGPVAPEPSLTYQSVTVTATVTGAGVIPTGTVGITISGQPSTCTIVLVGGTGSCNVVFDTVGVYTIVATYSGDGNYLGSVDNTYIHTVN
jgi:hypothetical protein